MKAMVLAAGLGTRLRPLTNERPKALVEVGGRTLLEITLARLRIFGIREVIINVHHFADLVVEYLKANDDFGMRIEISQEDELLDTGGGLLKAAGFFLRDSEKGSSVLGSSVDEPFILHNVDVLSSIDLGKMVKAHIEQDALATLAVQQRESSRPLLFNAQDALPHPQDALAPHLVRRPTLHLCGRRTAGKADEIVCAASPRMQAWAFAGIHVLSPRIFQSMSIGRLLGAGVSTRGGGKNATGAVTDAVTQTTVAGQPQQAFSIIPEYLRLAGGGENIRGFRADGYYWRDMGTLTSLQQAIEDMERNLIEF